MQVDRHDIELFVNGTSYRRVVESRMLLSDFLRHELMLAGTHVGCEHGVCGACTILLDGAPVRSCLMFAVQANGNELSTVEGLATASGELDPVQQAMHEHHGLQCGYCTAGMVMAAVSLLEEIPDPSERDVRVGIEGNLCRCTGYHNIVESVLAAAQQMRAQAR
jgi:aerobic-type carbon monoxide dehydrogenase small subunit (CoxS/CutS family)